MNNEEATTQPTIETVLKRINVLADEFRNGMQALHTEQQALRAEQQAFRESIEDRIGQLEFRLDKVYGATLTVRGNLGELRKELKEHIPELQPYSEL